MSTGLVVDIMGMILDSTHGNEIFLGDLLVTVIHDQQFDDLFFSLGDVEPFHENIGDGYFTRFRKLLERFDEKITRRIDHAEKTNQEIEQRQKCQSEGNDFPYDFQLVGVHIDQDQQGHENGYQDEHVPDQNLENAVRNPFIFCDKKKDHIKAHDE
jgi:hypothetical protein